jgi:hypothetical protein
LASTCRRIASITAGRKSGRRNGNREVLVLVVDAARGGRLALEVQQVPQVVQEARR